MCNYIQGMKQWQEKVIHLHSLKNPDALVQEMDSVAESLHRDGWYFVSSATDELMETVTLFFEKDLKV
jgi:hypothetical protein